MTAALGVNLPEGATGGLPVPNFLFWDTGKHTTLNREALELDRPAGLGQQHPGASFRSFRA